MDLSEAVSVLRHRRLVARGMVDILDKGNQRDRLRRAMAADYRSECQALDIAIDALTVKALVAPARASDPMTSHRAAPNEFKAGSKRELLLLAFAACGLATARSACTQAGLDPLRGSPWKRVSELKQAGFITPVGTEVDHDGVTRELYRATAKGLAKAEEINRAKR